MQRNRLVLILSLTLLFLSAYRFSTPVQAEDIDGFRGMKWGDPLPKEGMTFRERDPSFGGINKYIREGDNLKIGSAELYAILYSYWNGKFHSVDIICRGFVNFSPLLDAFKQKFGEIPDKPVTDDHGYLKGIEVYRWKNTPKTAIALFRNPIEDITHAVMSSLSIHSEQYKWDKEQAKNGKNDF